MTHLIAAEGSLSLAVAHILTVDAVLLPDQLGSFLRMQQRLSHSLLPAEDAHVDVKDGYASNISSSTSNYHDS